MLFEFFDAPPCTVRFFSEQHSCGSGGFRRCDQNAAHGVGHGLDPSMDWIGLGGMPAIPFPC